jgi:hypothetical protein
MTHFGIALALIAGFLLGGSVPLHAAEPTMTIPGGNVRVTQRGVATILAIIQHARATHTVLPADEAIYAGSLDTTHIIGVIPGQVLTLSSDYASRPNGGRYQCGAGTETVWRVIALRPVPQQTFHQRIASCWQSIDEGDTSWDSRTRQPTVERTTFDASGAHDLRTLYRITPEAFVTQIEVDQLP